MRISRRSLLAGLVAGVGTAAGGMRPAGGQNNPPPLEPDHEQILCAAAERLFPGVVEAGFADYCRYWLGREPFNHAADWRPLLVAGAAQLERVSRQRYQKGFVELSAQQQDGLLSEFQQGKVTSRKFRSDAFFQRLMTLALESYFGDPAYGGNRQQAGWEFAGHRHCWWAPRKRP